MSDAPPPLPEPGSVGEDDALLGEKRKRGGGCGKAKRCGNRFLDILDMTSLQTVQYMFFLIVFQSLVATFRNGNERYFTKFIEDTWTDNTFDSAHNTFNDIRRVSDIYEWMNTVMVPGMFSNADTGEAWPDGDGAFHLEGQTPYSTRELVDLTNSFGLQAFVIKTVRASDTTLECFHGFTCLDDSATSLGNSTTYNYPPATTLAPDPRILNMTLANELYAAEIGSGAALEAGSGSGGSSAVQTAPGAPLTTFKYLTTETLGASPAGLFTAHFNSLRVFPNDGFAAIFVPFFSNTFLPYERGRWDAVTDFRLFRATPRNGREPLYYCARYTLDGTEVVQGCNTNPARNDALVRGLMTQMLTELKKGHFLDVRTRLVSLHLQMANQHQAMAFTVRYMFEFTNLKGVLPSFDIETLIFAEESLHGMQMWLMLALVCTCWFCMLEIVELTQAGCMSYFVNIWNVIDWANFMLFFQAFIAWAEMIVTQWRDIELEDNEANGPPFECGSAICDQFGYFDPHEKMALARQAKFYTAFCITLQLLKIIKFTNVIVPKMSLMTRVLGKGATDLAFFGIIFGISVFAFTMLLFIQLGTFMDDFTSQEIALLGLVRALFGDFSFEEIMDNSRGYTNAILFLVYLFVSVFILLSMFLAILGEAQAAVRDQQEDAKESGTAPAEYGVFTEAVDRWEEARAIFSMSKKPALRRLSSWMGTDKPEEAPTVVAATAAIRDAIVASDGRTPVSALKESVDESLASLRHEIAVISEQVQTLQGRGQPVESDVEQVISRMEMLRKFEATMAARLSGLDTQVSKRLRADEKAWGKVAGEVRRVRRTSPVGGGVAAVAAAAAGRAHLEARIVSAAASGGGGGGGGGGGRPPAAAAASGGRPAAPGQPSARDIYPSLQSAAEPTRTGSGTQPKEGSRRRRKKPSDPQQTQPQRQQQTPLDA